MNCKIIFLGIICIALSHAYETCLPIDSDEANMETFSMRILLGEIAEKGEFPFIVSLQLKGKHICAGAIVHPEWILTAYHCLQQMDGLTIVDGTNVIGEGNVHQPKTSINYDDEYVGYDEDQYGTNSENHDISLLKVTPPFIMSNVTQAAVLPQKRKEIPGGTRAKVAGWGYTSPIGKSSDELKKLSVVICSIQECREMYWRYSLSTVEDQKICAMDTEGRGATGPGDSGGPLFTNDNELIGILCSGRYSTIKRVPTVYADISHYLMWIKRTLTWQ